MPRTTRTTTTERDNPVLLRMLTEARNLLGEGGLPDEELVALRRNERSERLAWGFTASACISAFTELSRRPLGSPGKDRVFEFPEGTVASIDLASFTTRLLTYTTAPKEAVTLAVIYLDRLVRSGVSLTEETSYRMLAAAFFCAYKFLCDKPNKNRHLAKVAGVRVEELNAIERHFLMLIDFRLDPTRSEWEMYERAMKSIAEICLIAPCETEREAFLEELFNEAQMYLPADCFIQ